MKAQMFLCSAFNFFSNSSVLSNSIKSNPGVNGPKLVYHTGSSDAPDAVIDLPQKQPFANITFALSGSIPLASYPHHLAILIEVSAASHPVFIGRILS